MENQISLITQLETILNDLENNVKMDKSLVSLMEANDLYNKLLNEGLIKKRGYSLRGIEDAHLYKTKLNRNFNISTSTQNS